MKLIACSYFRLNTNILLNHSPYIIQCIVTGFNLEQIYMIPF